MALSAVAPVPGRMQRIAGADLEVVVDYAHTPDALEKALLALQPDPALAARTLELALTQEIPATFAANLMAAVASEHPELAFEFADVLAWLATIANVAQIDLQAAVQAKYGNGCPGCHQMVCV